MFKWLKKKQNKDFEFKISIIEKIGTLEAQNKFLWDRIQQLENRIEILEQKAQVGF